MGSSLATAPAKRLVCWGSVRVVTTGWRRVVTTRLAQVMLGQGAAEVAAEAVRSMPLRSRKICCGSAGAASPKADAYLQAYSAAGFQEMWPAYAPTGAGKGDAVSGINRADSASVSGNDAAPCACRMQLQSWSGRGRFPVRPVAEHYRRWCPHG